MTATYIKQPHIQTSSIALHTYRPPHMYASDMLGIQAECATFFSIMKEDYPDLSAILARRGALEVGLSRRERLIVRQHQRIVT